MSIVVGDNVIGGLTSSTIIALFFIPLIYTFVNSKRIVKVGIKLFVTESE